MILLALAAAAQVPTSCHYTAKDLEDLRSAVEDKFVWGRYGGPLPSPKMDRGGLMSNPVSETEMQRYITNMVPLFVGQCIKRKDLIAEENRR